MKKLSAILIIISLLVSVFDIIDTSDITIAGKNAFSSNNGLDQDSLDNIDFEVLLNQAALIFNLVETSNIVVLSTNSNIFFPVSSKSFYIDCISALYEPPIV